MTRRLVLITGGAGFLGINLCRFLLARGFAVRILDTAPFDYPERASVEVVYGDICDPILVERAMLGVSYVIHAAAAAPSRPKEEIFSTNVTGTWTVLQAALRVRPERFIYLSCAAVYGAQSHHLIRENDPLHGVGAYAESKIEAEHLCESARLSGTCISILRLTSVVGPARHRTFAALYERAFAGKSLPTLGSGRRPSQILDIEDACQAIYQCLSLSTELVNDTFNVGARSFATIRETLQAVLNRAGHGRRVIQIPAAPVARVMSLLEGGAVGSSRYSWVRETAGQDVHLSIRHIGVKLGFQPRCSSAVALSRDYERYVRFRSNHAGVRETAGYPELI
jgi:nucleoside-diphosphate-sugar epimerase